MNALIFGSYLFAAVAQAGLSIEEVAEKGKTLGNLAPAAIWAVVALISLLGLIKLYIDKGKEGNELKLLIRETTAAITKNTEVLEELSDSVAHCTKNNG